MIRITLACVPEHFSIPLHQGVKNGVFKDLGIDVVIKEYTRGTGSMCKALRKKKVEVAIALTEGLISGLSN
jgi:sulfonate transport system substrate-binding protein